MSSRRRKDKNSKRERKTYIQLSAEFQKMARRDKKALNNKRGKDQRYLQENWKHQGNIHPRMGTKKYKSGTDLVDTEEIKKRWK